MAENRKEYEKRNDSSRMPVDGGDPLGTMDNLLSGLWYGLDESKKYAGELAGSVNDFIGGVIGDLGLTDTVNTFSGLYNTSIGFTNGMFASIGTGLSNFVERTGNLFAQGSFATDLEIRDAQQRKEFRGLIALNGSEVPIGNGFMNNSAYMQKFREMEDRMNGGGIYEGANSKAVEDIMEKLKDGKLVDASDLQKLTATMLQKSTLPKEVLDSILNDKDSFKELAGKTFDFGENGKVKLDLNDPESIKAYADNISKVYCVAASLYGQMVVNGIDGTPGSFGEFTKQLLEKDLINPDKPARQINSTQDIIDAFAGKGKYQVVGYGADAGGGYFNDEFGNSTKGINPADTLNNLKDAAKNNQNINFFNIRINNPHSMNLYNNSGRLSIFDTSARGFGASFTNSVTRTNISSWYYIKRANRR